MKHKADSPPVTTGPVVIVERSADTAEMLHTFFRLMELAPVILSLPRDLSGLPDTIRRLHPAAVIVGLAPPDLRLLEVAHDLRAHHPTLPIVLLTDTAPRRPASPPPASREATSKNCSR